MSDDGDKAIRILPFSGKKEAWTMWSRKFVTRAMTKKYKDVLLGTIVPPKHDEDLNVQTADGRVKAKAREANERAYNDLMLSCEEDVCFGIVDAARTENLPDGDAAKAWKGLLAKYEPSTAAEKVKLDREFTKSALKNASDDPDAWLTELERKRQQMKTLGMTKEDDDIIRHVLNNLPKEYDATVEHLEYLMKKEELTLEVLRDTLNSRFEKLSIREGKNDEADEEKALVAGNFKKKFKGACRLCGVIGHQANQCWEDEKNKDKRPQGWQPGRH